MSALEDLENQVNDMINTMRRLDAMQADPTMAANHPKLKELAHRLGVQMEHSRKRMAESGFEEPAPGQPEPDASGQTPQSIVSSPYAGEEPRHVVQHDGHPDPIAKAQPTEESEAEAPTEMRDVERRAATTQRQTTAPQRQQPAPRQDDSKKK